MEKLICFWFSKIFADFDVECDNMTYFRVFSIKLKCAYWAHITWNSIFRCVYFCVSQKNCRQAKVQKEKCGEKEKKSQSKNRSSHKAMNFGGKNWRGKFQTCTKVNSLPLFLAWHYLWCIDAADAVSRLDITSFVCFWNDKIV